jgi:hypothetical protein
MAAQLVGAGAQGFKMATQEGTPYGVHLVTAICLADAIYKFNCPRYKFNCPRGSWTHLGHPDGRYNLLTQFTSAAH